MTDAQKNSDKVLEASNKEIIGMLIEDSKESIDKKFEDEEKKLKIRKKLKKNLNSELKLPKLNAMKKLIIKMTI